MTRPTSVSLFLAALLALPGRCPAQTQAAPLYSLPADGTWVEYGWAYTPPDGPESRGTLRISSVGRAELRGEACRWVEIKLIPGEGDAGRVRLRKLLVSEKAVQNGASLSGAVRACYDKTGDRVRPVIGKARLDFLGLAVREGGLREAAPAAEAQTKLGKYAARHVVSDGRGPGRDYHGWLTDKVPFGWARFEVRERGEWGKERTVFQAVVARTGGGASPEVAESRAR